MNFRLETMVKIHTTQDLKPITKGLVLTTFYSTERQLIIQQRLEGICND